MNHNNLIQRINRSTSEEFSTETERPGKEWRDFDIRYGNRHFEAIFSVTKAVRFVKKLFKKGETK